MKPVKVNLPTPEMGNKIWLLQQKGVYILEEGPGMLAGISSTYAGGVTLEIYDGIPDADGFFPKPASTEGAYNGRSIWRSHPLYMGMNQLNGGFHHGLTVICDGSVDPTVSITWAAVKSSPKKAGSPGSPTKVEPPFDSAKEVRAPSAPNSLTRSHVIDTPGVYHLARRDCELYCVNVIRSGMSSRIRVYDGLFRPLFSLPAGSAPGFCSDSFPIGGFCEKGMYVTSHSRSTFPLFGVTWREKDLQLV